jgi:hypothetical protein
MLDLVHLELEEANAFVAALHRHHKPVRGHRFSVGARSRFDLVGVAIVGRPVSRELDFRRVCEVLRLCTDGTRNACSFLYAAAARACLALGYARIGTYVLSSESGVTLVAAGWTKGHTVRGRDWNEGKRKGRRTDQPMDDKIYWYKEL